jgi:DNA transformation protein
MIGMIFDDIIYFKTDQETRQAFTAANCKPFTFVKHKSGETVVTTWFALPDRLYDEPDDLAEWARAALTVARKAPAERKKKQAAKRKARQPPKRRRA